jgi:hypothetical protein
MKSLESIAQSATEDLTHGERGLREPHARKCGCHLCGVRVTSECRFEQLGQDELRRLGDPETPRKPCSIEVGSASDTVAHIKPRTRGGSHDNGSKTA